MNQTGIPVIHTLIEVMAYVVKLQILDVLTFVVRTSANHNRRAGSILPSPPRELIGLYDSVHEFYVVKHGGRVVGLYFPSLVVCPRIVVRMARLKGSIGRNKNVDIAIWRILYPMLLRYSPFATVSEVLIHRLRRRSQYAENTLRRD